MIHYQHCPVCASERISRILSARDYTVSGQVFEIWQCANCTVRFTQNIPSASEIGDYYQSEQYISHTETSKGLVNSLYLKVRRFTLASKGNLIEERTGKNKGTLLDIGAGTGAFVHHMQQAGWEAEGLEPDAGAIKKAADQYGVTLRPSEELFHMGAVCFDVITMWHVLEHVHELHGYVTQLRQLLRPEGRIFIAVPNYTSYDATLYGGQWAAYDVPRHLYHFSPASMQILMEKHGLLIEDIRPMWLDSFYVSLLSEKYRKGKAGLLKGFWNGLRSNRRAMTNPRKASSLIYVIRKK